MESIFIVILRTKQCRDWRRTCPYTVANSSRDRNEGRGRSIASAFYLSLDDHTIYAYPDGMHDVMTLWVCDMQGNVIEEVLFEMNGTRQSHVLPASLAGEYEVYLKVGNSYYLGSVRL